MDTSNKSETGSTRKRVTRRRNEKVASVTRIGAETFLGTEHKTLEEAVKVTVDSLPWRTSQDSAAVKLALKLSKVLDNLISDGEKNNRPVDQRFINNNIRELGDLLLKVLVELGATPMARNSLNTQTEVEDEANPLREFKNKRASRP